MTDHTFEFLRYLGDGPDLSQITVTRTTPDAAKVARFDFAAHRGATPLALSLSCVNGSDQLRHILFIDAAFRLRAMAEKMTMRERTAL